MARKGKARKKIPDGLGKITAPKYYEFELQAGRIITYTPMNPDLVQAIRDTYADPEPPMKEIPTVAGDVDLEPDLDNPEYQEALTDSRRGRAEALLRLLAVQSLEHLEPPDDWIEKQQFIMPDWEAPEDPLACKAYWIEHWLVTNPLDLAALVQAAAIAAALTPAEVEKALASFRTEMAGTISKQTGAAIKAALDELRVGDTLRERLGGDTSSGVPETAKELAS